MVLLSFVLFTEYICKKKKKTDKKGDKTTPPHPRKSTNHEGTEKWERSMQLLGHAEMGVLIKKL